MRIMGKQEWIEAIESKLVEFGDGILSLDDYTRKHLRAMSRKQLAAIEHLIASCHMVTCTVGCGECETCREHNKRAAKRAKSRAR